MTERGTGMNDVEQFCSQIPIRWYICTEGLECYDIFRESFQVLETFSVEVTWMYLKSPIISEKLFPVYGKV